MRRTIAIIVVLCVFSFESESKEKKRNKRKVIEMYANLYYDFTHSESIPLKRYWDWKGGGGPIFIDSLVCTNSELFRLARYNFSHLDEEEDFLRERLMIYSARIDTIDNNIVFNFLEDGILRGYNASIYEHLTGKGKFNPNSASDFQGFWRVDGKTILVYGNYVDHFFERFMAIEMASPLAKRKDNSYNSLPWEILYEGGSRFYIYEDEVANEYYITKYTNIKKYPVSNNLYETNLPYRISHYFYDPKIYRESMQEALKNKQLHFR